MQIKSNGINDVKEYFHSKLDSIYGGNEVNSFIKLAFDFYFNIDFSKQVFENHKFSESEILIIVRLVKRLLKHEPIQYIFGETEFYGNKFLVNSNVLIPRPETEELVHWILSDYKEAVSPLKVLDVGTGSGCIAICLAKAKKNFNVSALDVSYAALQTAIENAKRNEVDMYPVCADIGSDTSKNLGIDIIVSNPPYVLNSDKNEMHENVLRYEPHLALFVEDAEPLYFYRAILKFAVNNLNKGGRVYFEIHYKMGDAMISLLKDFGFKSIVLKKDLSGKDRIIKGVI